MADPVWLSALPPRPLRQGYSRNPMSRTIGAPVAQGDAKSRPLFTGRVDVIALSYKMTSAQLSEFEAFFDVTLTAGALVFDLPDPEDGAAAPPLIAVRFPPGERPYSVNPAAAPGMWIVTLNLRTAP